MQHCGGQIVVYRARGGQSIFVLPRVYHLAHYVSGIKAVRPILHVKLLSRVGPYSTALGFDWIFLRPLHIVSRVDCVLWCSSWRLLVREWC